MIDFLNVKLPFNVGDLLSSTNGVLALIGGFVLLGLIYNFVPHIISAIFYAIYFDNKYYKNDNDYRFRKSEFARNTKLHFKYRNTDEFTGYRNTNKYD